MEAALEDPQRPIVVVSADSHIGPRLEDLRDYCPTEHVEAFDRFAGSNRRVPFLDFPPGDPRADHPAGEQGKEVAAAIRSTAGHHDMHARLRDMDRDGVAAAVIFHGSQNGEPFPFMDTTKSAAFFDPQHNDLGLVRIGMRMYNRWLADQCSVAPDRNVGLAHVPMWDIDAAIEEVEWSHANGLRGVNFPAPRDGIRAYDDPAWEPFWSTCEGLGMPLVTHAGAGTPDALHGRQRILLMVLEGGGWPCRRALHRLVFAGVFERHPGLRLVFTELTEYTEDWWPSMLREFDRYFERGGWMLGDQMSSKPSEYVRSNVYIGDSLMHRSPERSATIALEGGWADNLLWGSDYPHVEGTWSPVEPGSEPTTRLALRESFAGVPLRAVRRIAGETASRVYGLDMRRLAEIASQIDAPLPADLAVAPAGVPDHWRAPSVTAL